MINSKCLIGNSSVGIRECSFLGIPVVNIGSRQNRRMRGYNVIDVDYEENKIINAIQHQLKFFKKKNDAIYGNGDAGKKMADIIASVKLETAKVISY